MLEFAFKTRRGSFTLDVAGRFASPWTVLFGPSGAGKTTLLRLLAGLDGSGVRPETAHVILDGRCLTDLAADQFVGPGRRGIAMVVQQAALFPHMSVEANVAYGVSRLNASARAARAEAMLEMTGASALRHRPARTLSGGEAQRVALARALAPQPQLLLLDEPFSALDGAASDALLSRLQGWTREHNVQVVMATHDATDALAMDAEVALLQDGRLTAVGPAAETLAAEKARLLARLD